jgi:hypothetical protein
MGDGQLRCCGSSLFLKNAYGVGYNMTIEKMDATSFDSRKMADVIGSRIPEAKLLTDVGTELTFQLPLSSSDKFQPLFEYMDAHERELGLQSYGMSVTTLEEVFIRVAEGTHTQADAQAGIKKLQNKGGSHGLSFKQLLSPVPVVVDIEAGPGLFPADVNDFKKIPEEQQLLYFFRHCFAMIAKRCLYFIRDIKAMIAQYFAPILIVLIGMLIMHVSTSINSHKCIFFSDDSILYIHLFVLFFIYIFYFIFFSLFYFILFQLLL